MDELPELLECSRKAYEKWKAELAEKGKIPTDAVDYCRSIGMEAYAETLEEVIAEYEAAPVPGGEEEPEPAIVPCSVADSYRHILRCLLHYHERMMLMYEQCPSGGCDTAIKSNVDKGKCIRTLLGDPYAEALKEAIRCIEIVHKGEFTE